MQKLLLTICFVLYFLQSGWGQMGRIDSLHTAYDQLYGLDVILNNGKKYFPDRTPAKGHPFWGSQESFSADLTISGKIFKDQQLKYNIHKQDFLLLYSDLNGQNCQIILNTPFIDSVRTGSILFVRNSYPEIGLPFVRMIYHGNLSCCAGLKKKLDFAAIGVNTGYSYSNEIRTYYLIMNQKAYPFSNKSSFLKIFPSVNRAVIRKQMSLHRMKFKKMNETILRQLVEFCDHTVR